MPRGPMPESEVEVDSDLVAELVSLQWDGWGEQPVTLLANGWDNFLFRLGERWLVRLPRRAASVPLVENEARWLPELADRLPLPVPAPVFVGAPGPDYPWPWTIVPWIKGESLATSVAINYDAIAGDLARFLRALHVPAPPDAPSNPFRGVPLADRDEGVAGRIRSLGDPARRGRAAQIWAEAVEAPAHSGPPVWLHGDLHPHNILVDGGRPSGVIDFGDITSGDPATDLSIAWMILPQRSHSGFRNDYGRGDEACWTRARGWALALGLAFAANSADNPVMSSVGADTLDAVLGS